MTPIPQHPAWSYLLLVALSSLHTGLALRCYECLDLEDGTITNVTSLGLGDIDLQSFYCEVAPIHATNSLPWQECATGQLCMALRGTIVLPDNTSTVLTLRGCRDAVESGCASVTSSPDAQRLGVDLNDDSSEFCYCERDFCSPIGCGEGYYVSLNNYCLAYWFIMVTLFVLFLALTLLTGFCCCCCVCCRPRKTSAAIDQPDTKGAI